MLVAREHERAHEAVRDPALCHEGFVRGSGPSLSIQVGEEATELWVRGLSVQVGGSDGVGNRQIRIEEKVALHDVPTGGRLVIGAPPRPCSAARARASTRARA